jgi:hypothetical protein
MTTLSNDFQATITSSPLLILFNDMVVYFVCVDYLGESSEAEEAESSKEHRGERWV